MFENKDYQEMENVSKEFARGCMYAAVKTVNEIFGTGYAAMNPEIVIAHMKICADNYSRLMAMKFNEELVSTTINNICIALDGLNDAICYHRISPDEVSGFVDKMRGTLLDVFCADKKAEPVKTVRKTKPKTPPTKRK